MSSAARKIKQLRSEAIAFAMNDEPRLALEKLAALESLQPSEPDWPRRAAECHRLLGNRAEQLSALGRAADGYVSAGMVVKAMAICKMMLAIAPEHPTALDWMGKLERPLGMPSGGGRVLLPVVGDLAASSQVAASTPQPPEGTASGTAQKLAAQRGLVAVARAVARQSGRKRTQHLVPSGAPTPPPLAPRAPSSPPSGNWHEVDDAELLESEAIEQSPVLSLPPLSANAELRSLVPGSLPLIGGHGTPSGMFRLAIDGAPQTRGEKTLRQAREVLPAVPLFSEIDPSNLEKLIRQSRLIHLQPGEVVFKQDDSPECLYVIVNGSVAVIDEAAASGELYRLGENEFFGEAALISNDPRPTTVKASEECDLMAFDREAMRECVADSPAVVAVLLRFLRGRMIEHLVHTSPLFTNFDTAERRALSRKFEFIEVAEGALLIEQGALAPGLFVLLSGAVDVVLRREQREHWLATLERGGVFGEISLLTRRAAIADVTSTCPGFALMLPAAAFREVIMTHPPFLEVLTLLSQEREQANQRRLHTAGLSAQR